MHTLKGGDYIVYDTFEELLKTNPIIMTEYKGYYYIKPKLQGYYDNFMYKVNKTTLEVDSNAIDYIDYMLDIEDKATPVNLMELKKAS